MRKLKYASILAVLASFFLCTSCSQDEEVQLIQDGAEAATIAGVIALSADPATAPFASIIDKGLGEASATAIQILNDASSTLTLQQVLDLAFSQDPNLAQIQALVDFVLPVLMDISAVQKALNSAVQNINPTVKADVIAFFTGVQAGLGDSPTQAQLDKLLRDNPKLVKAAKKLGLGKFDTGALIAAVKSASAKK